MHTDSPAGQPTAERSALTVEHVAQVFADSMVRSGVVPEDEDITTVTVDGIVHSVTFNLDKLEFHRQEVAAMLGMLPDQFRKSGGGGWSFLQACEDRWGHQWTGMHAVMEQLFLLGLALDLVECLFPRPMWDALPGGVPYYVVKL